MVNIRTTCTNVNKLCILFTEYILICCSTIFPKLYQLVCLCNVSCKVETELLSIIYMTFRLRRLTLKHTCPSTYWRRSDNLFVCPSYEMLYQSSGNGQDLLPRWLIYCSEWGDLSSRYVPEYWLQIVYGRFLLAATEFTVENHILRFFIRSYIYIA
jgi:hypothetical protein